MKWRPALELLLLAAVLILVYGSVVASASAHTLWKRSAALDARLELAEYAEYLCSRDRTCESASYPRLTKYDCVRPNRAARHTIWCYGAFTLYDAERAEFDQLCSADARVRYRSHRSYRTRVRISNVSC